MIEYDEIRKSHPAKFASAEEIHRSADEDEAGVADEIPGRRTLPGEDGFVARVKRLELDLQKLGEVSAIANSTGDGQRLVVAPPIVLRVDRRSPHLKLAGG